MRQVKLNKRTTIMIGEKGANHVRGRALLPAENVPVYVAPNCQTAQR